MITGTFTIINPHGLHARAASKLVAISSKFDSSIDITSQKETINGKSIIHLVIMAAEQGASLEIRCSGSDEKEAFSALSKLVENGFGEI